MPPVGCIRLCICLFLRMEIEKGEIFSEADQSHDLYADFIVCFYSANTLLFSN